MKTKTKFKVGDKVQLTLKGLQEFSRSIPASASPTREWSEYFRGLQSIYDSGTVGVVERVFDSKNMNVDFYGNLFHIYSYMIISVKDNPPESKAFNQYLYTILWSSTREDGQALDSYYDIDDFAEEALEKASKDWEKFQEKAGFLLDGLDLEQVAHDFWLTRNRHGAGFWDGDYEEVVADKLTELSHSFKEQDAYIGDDDFIYLS